MIPGGRQTIEAVDVEVVTAALRAERITTGPAVSRFERAVADFTGAAHAVAVSSGTAALHAATAAANIGVGDEVVVPAITFVATANAVVFQGAIPVFADVDPGTLLVDPAGVEAVMTERTRAVIAVDYAGQPCPYDALRELARARGVTLIADACHSLGASYRGGAVGTLADLTAFSFHPIKAITTGEGGMVVTESPEMAGRMRKFRNHGIDRDADERTAAGTWDYDMTELGWNYRLTDFQCALGERQLRRLPSWIDRRREIGAQYDAVWKDHPRIRPLASADGAAHARHLYVVRLGDVRDAAFRALRAAGIGANVHYRPVYHHAYYRSRFGNRRGACPVAERAAEEILSLPIFPSMADGDVSRVIEELTRFVDAAR